MRKVEGKKKIDFKSIFALIKMALCMMMVVLSYGISDKFIDYILVFEPSILKRILNVILVFIIMVAYIVDFNKENKE